MVVVTSEVPYPKVMKNQLIVRDVIRAEDGSVEGLEELGEAYNVECIRFKEIFLSHNIYSIHSILLLSLSVIPGCFT
jgi:hypothetical protein